MDLAPLIFARVTSNANLYALVGSRMYPDDATPDNPTVPYVVFGEVALDQMYALDGDTRNATTHFQFDIYAESRDTAKRVSDAIKDATRNWTSTDTSPRIQRCWVTGEMAEYLESPEGDRKRFFRRVIDLSIWADD